MRFSVNPSHPVPLDQPLAQVDANPKLHPAILRELGIARHEFLLKRGGAFDCVDHAGKLGQKVITRARWKARSHDAEDAAPRAN